MSKKIIVVGSGISGLSAALYVAKAGGEVLLVAPEPSERSQSIMAAGGINASGIVDNPQDSIQLHRDETLSGGCHIASSKAVEKLCENAPHLIKELEKMGMVFSRDKNGAIMSRAFGGQSQKRTIFSGSSTGKQIVSALNREVRYYESKQKIKRQLHTYFLQGAIENDTIYGVFCFDMQNNEVLFYEADAVILASGGQNILFGKTTGSTLCDGGAVSALFQQGVQLKNLEMIQYHPTTIETSNKRMLITEAARGEGGRLFYIKNDERVYFMEEKYGPNGNLMPRDIVSREIYLSKEKVYLDIAFLGKKAIEERLVEVQELCREYISLEVSEQPIPIAPSVHFFMGGVCVDIHHATNIHALYAVGECASMYHGANRLGGNSLLAAMYSGNVAAKHCMQINTTRLAKTNWDKRKQEISEGIHHSQSEESNFSPEYILKEIERIMNESLGIVREHDALSQGLDEIEFYLQANKKIIYNTVVLKNKSIMMENYLILAKAILLSALARKESRGAHYRLDYPNTENAYCASSIAHFDMGKITITFEKENE